MTNEQATIMIGLLTEIREELRRQSMAKDESVLRLIVNPVGSLGRAQLDDLKKRLVAEISKGVS